MHRSRPIPKPKPVRLVDHIQDPAHIHRPQPQSTRLDRNNFLNLDPRLRIRNPYPTQIELPPLPQCRPGSLKSLPAPSNLTPRVIQSKPTRHNLSSSVAFGIKR